MPGLFTLQPNCANWLALSQSVPRDSFAIVGLDRAVDAYGTTKNPQTCLRLMSYILRWRKSPGFRNVAAGKKLIEVLCARLKADFGVKVNTNACPMMFYKTLPGFADDSIVVGVNNPDDVENFFVYSMHVSGALTEIGNGLLGAILIQSIRQQSAGRWPYTVCIYNGHRNCCNPAQADKAFDEINAHLSWDPTKLSAGDGTADRPTYIGLAHEMIHAYHFAAGVNQGGSMGTPEEEASTVGLSRWWVNPAQMYDVKYLYPYFDRELDINAAGSTARNIRTRNNFTKPTLHITENMIRHEHGVPLRLFYKGVVGLDKTPEALTVAMNNPNAYAKDLGVANQLYGV